LNIKTQCNGPNKDRESSITFIEHTKPKPEQINGSITSNTESTMQPSKPLMTLAHHELLLKRNCQAAKRCRQKRKLQDQQDELTLKTQAARNKELLAGTKRLQYQVLGLRLEILKHSQCEGYIKRYVEQMTGRVLREDTASDV
jgi:predicted nucleotide-binding protein (sugar kinase/HSP70/actin superfamily)